MDGRLVVPHGVFLRVRQVGGGVAQCRMVSSCAAHCRRQLFCAAMRPISISCLTKPLEGQAQWRSQVFIKADGRNFPFLRLTDFCTSARPQIAVCRSCCHAATTLTAAGSLPVDVVSVTLPAQPAHPSSVSRLLRRLHAPFHWE